MIWLVFFALLTLAGALGTLLNVNRLRFERRFARETRALLAAPASGLTRSAMVELPPPVARYYQLTVGDRAPVHRLRLRPGGSFRMNPSAKPLPIQGTQAFTVNPPGFLWLGTIRIGCGMWMHARDMLVQGQGSMLVHLQDLGQRPPGDRGWC